MLREYYKRSGLAKRPDLRASSPHHPKGTILMVLDSGRSVKPVIPALEYAHLLADMGVPVFSAMIMRDGEPDTKDHRWNGWERTKAGAASHRAIDRYGPGMALGAVGGSVLDFIDYDPRNDPDASGLAWLREVTSEIIPVTRVKTPSGGWHMGIPALDLAKGTITSGVDYQGGLREPDSHGKTRRGFVFIPPTVRPSKVTGERLPYEATDFNRDIFYGPYEELREAIEAKRAATARARRNGTGSRSGRLKPSEYREQCLTAVKGQQRDALLRIIKEWQYRGYDKEDILNLYVQLTGEMQAYDPDWLWYDPNAADPQAVFDELLMNAGTFTADAAPGELAGIRSMVPLVSAGDSYISADDISEETIEWLNKPFLPFGCLVIVDGDPGQGKSVITTGMVARAAHGLPVLPFGKSIVTGELHCGMIGAEDDISQAVKGRLRAAGYANNRHVWFMGLKRDKRGHVEILTFPRGTERVRAFIVANGLKLLVIDPISAFIGVNVQTHNEASVRAALAPLAEIARDTGCCIILVRHLNKDGSMKALYRGTGSIAFSAIARSGFITGVCPDGSYGLAHVKCSYAERFDGVVRYSVGKWEQDEAIPVIDWGDIDEELTADELAKGPGARKGPEPQAQDDIRAVLEPMFKERDTWDQDQVIARLREAGITSAQKTIDKVRRSMGIAPGIGRRDKKTGLILSWTWTTRR
jgi:AAA domain-containing protein